tara:strand:+ start:12538 stop:14205 length:1668 start_codon:yes stop_codon:yes gene_type:complete
MVSNPNFYGQSTHGTPNQIEDGVDFPHTGIIKALSDGLGQNYAISGFDITIDSATQIDVGAGVIFRDGKRVAVSAVANLTLSSTYTNGYHLLIASSASSPVLTIRNPTAADKVAQYTAGDTIIAVITHNGTANVGIQYLTVNKTENSLSIGRDDSGYTESATIKSNAGDVEFESLETDKDIIFKVKDGSSVVDRLVLYGDNDPSFPNTEVKIEGSLLVTEDIQANKISLGYANSPTSGLAEIQAYSSSEPMVFKTGSAVERLRITTDGKVGIGTGNPTGILHVKGTSSSDIDFLIEVAEDGGSASPDVVYYRNSASPAAGDDLAHLRFRGKDSAGSTADYVDIFAEIVDPTDGSEDGRITFRTLKNGAITSRIELDSDETVFNDAGADINFRVEGDTNANLIFADAGQDKVGIGTSTVGDGVLSLSGAINTKGRIQNVVHKAGDNGLSGGPPLSAYDILKTDDLIIASAPAAGGGQPPQDLMLNLPDAESVDIGRTYRIVAKVVGDTLQINRTGSDDSITDTTGAVLSLPYSLAAGKIYDITCVDADMWMLMQLN